MATDVGYDLSRYRPPLQYVIQVLPARRCFLLLDQRGAQDALEGKLDPNEYATTAPASTKAHTETNSNGASRNPRNKVTSTSLISCFAPPPLPLTLSSAFSSFPADLFTLLSCLMFPASFLLSLLPSSDKLQASWADKSAIRRDEPKDTSKSKAGRTRKLASLPSSSLRQGHG
eukprot:652417-Hanusia_phi.AAC.5